MTLPFHSIYRHGFVRVAACVPAVRVAEPAFNTESTLELAYQASESQAAVALFPELGLAGYTSDDLFHQDALLAAVRDGLAQIVEASRQLLPLLLVGAPLRLDGRLFNCAVAIHRGRILGAVPKTYLPNYREFYEKRQFTSSRGATRAEISLLGQVVPFGTDLIFSAANVEGFKLHAEICEDLWAPIPPSTYAALGGATLLANLSGSPITIGKADYRREICGTQSGKCVAAYLYAGAGLGESTNDLAWDGHALIYENGSLLAESQRFQAQPQMIMADIDLERLEQDRMRLTSFTDSVANYAPQLQQLRYIPFELDVPQEEVRLQRHIGRFPYVPSDPSRLSERCAEVYNIQVQGLVKRLQATGIQRVVIGVSGGLDSTQALIVAARAMDYLDLPRTNILAYTMPGFATSKLTHGNAHRLMQVVGATAQEIDIRPSALQMLRDLGHPFVHEEEQYDITFENVQAGERTSHLFRLANYHNALVLGTGDLSELALGWATYGVGDQMSHYNVNASVPKTLIQYLIRWGATTSQLGPDAYDTLISILNTEISPELVPHKEGEANQPAQSTEAKIGPYELQDFNLYYTSRFGFKPSKVAFLSHHAWSDRTRGNWPELLPAEKRTQYNLQTIKKWLDVFLFRFFQISQFKRTAIPNGPKVGSGGSLSPRGDWRAPSDSAATLWLEELRRNVPDEDE